MNLTTDQVKDIVVVRVNETRMMYPSLGQFSETVTGLIDGGHRKIIIDLSSVDYIDSATIGCLMDLYRQLTAGDGAFALAGLRPRVETMLTMTGAHNFIDLHSDEQDAVRSLEGSDAHD